MNEIWQIFLGSMMVAFSGALVIGPMFTLVVTSVAQQGFWASFFIVTGHSLLELAVVASFYLGLLKYLDNPIVLKVVSLLGGAFLIYMGVNILISIFRKKIKLDLNTNSGKNKIDGKNTFIIVGKGILISLSNPFWYVWWLSIGAAFMIKSVKFSFAGVSSFYVGHIIADFIWYLFIGFIISSGRRFFNQKVYIGILIVCSLFLLYLGIKFIADFF